MFMKRVFLFMPQSRARAQRLRTANFAGGETNRAFFKIIAALNAYESAMLRSENDENDEFHERRRETMGR